MFEKHYSQTSSMRRVRLWISISSLWTWISISTNIWVLFKWQTNSSLPPGAGTTLSGHLLLFSFLFGAECQGLNSSTAHWTTPPPALFTHTITVSGRLSRAGGLLLRWAKHTQKCIFSTVNIIKKSFSPILFSSCRIKSTWLRCFLLCITVEFLSNHILACLCCQVPRDLPEALRINIADYCSESVNAPLSTVAWANHILRLRSWDPMLNCDWISNGESQTHLSNSRAPTSEGGSESKFHLHL